MDNLRFRSFLLKLQDRLSDNDRQRLHFFLGNDIPRRIRDNPTLQGTLNLLECLFDQDKISEQDFTFLIDAFKEIQCIDAVKLLRDYKQKMQTNCCNQSTLTSIMPPLNEEVIQDQEDDNSAAYNLLQQINAYGSFNKIINSSNTNINPVTITVDDQKIVSIKSGKTRSLNLSLKANKYLYFILLLLMIILGLSLIIAYVLRIKKNDSLDFREEYEKLLEEQKTKNEMIRINERKNSVVFPGQIFGYSIERAFDDSSRSDFMSLPYLNGLYVRDNQDGLESYQFFYLSSHDQENVIESEVDGNQTENFKRKFFFTKNERIIRVQGRLVKKNLVSQNGTSRSISIITGLEFVSRKHRMSPSYGGELGEVFSEEYDGYMLGYIRGRSAQYVEQVQFVWYRTVELDSD
ncbi:unnamed protein product [Adineta ricciae]|uniref:Uncharacterized protein n=1 Tax=Adineta ricciae TaxID=249248 RepID=A0A816F109_ADIRI|nr:unnamed protein product [Adineta ricciae]CAF1656783.1 unnamed protein product [Adineta ricciae]